MAGDATACYAEDGMHHKHAVLLVEDNADVCEALMTLLETHGYDVVCARDGQDALDELERGLRPCLILLDMMMPRVSGEEFRARQQANPAWRDLPIALYTGDGRAREKAARLGVRSWFVKPLDVERLLQVVAMHCTAAGPGGGS